MGEYKNALAEMDTTLDRFMTILDILVGQLTVQRAAQSQACVISADEDYTVVVTRSKRAPRASKWTNKEWRDSYWEESYFAPSLEKRRNRRASGKTVALTRARGKVIREMKRAQLRDIDTWVTEEV